jgi:apolipoprotein N-acyltransferase
MFERMQELTRETWSCQPRPDLIIWPETTYPCDWLVASPETPAEEMSDDFNRDCQLCQKLAKEYAQFSAANILVGLNCAEMMPGGRFQTYNSALLLRRDGVPGGRYDKIHCVPFGEYVPMRTYFPWMQVFSPYKHDYSMTCGENRTRFDLSAADGKTYRFGAIICYEDSDPLLARGYSRADPVDGAPVDFLVNITNDGWFNGTEEHEQHLAISRFRAIEARRSLVRSVNMGISAVIDGNGRVVALPGPTWRDSKKVAAAFAATVPIDGRSSFYSIAGDWLPQALAVCLGVLVIVSRRKSMDRRISASRLEIGAASP